MHAHLIMMYAILRNTAKKLVTVLIEKMKEEPWQGNEEGNPLLAKAVSNLAAKNFQETSGVEIDIRLSDSAVILPTMGRS